MALQRRLRIPLWDRDTACGMCGGVFDRWGDHALPCCCGGIGSCATTRSEMWSAPRSPTPELEKPGLLLPPRPPDPGGPPLDADASSAFSPLLVAALPMSGFPGACAAPLKPGISLSRRCFAPLTSLLLLPRSPMSSTKWNPGSAFSRTRLLLLLNGRPPFARLSWRLVGRGREGEMVPSSSERRSLDCL